MHLILPGEVSHRCGKSLRTDRPFENKPPHGWMHLGNHVQFFCLRHRCPDPQPPGPSEQSPGPHQKGSVQPQDCQVQIPSVTFQRGLTSHPFGPCYVNCGPQASRVGTAWELVRNAQPRLGPRTSESESALEQIPRGISTVIKVEKP